MSPGISSECLHSSLPYSQKHTTAEVRRQLRRLSRLTSLAKVGSAGCSGHLPSQVLNIFIEGNLSIKSVLMYFSYFCCAHCLFCCQQVFVQMDHFPLNFPFSRLNHAISLSLSKTTAVKMFSASYSTGQMYSNIVRISEGVRL